jgi:G patch domain-containing protein 1
VIDARTSGKIAEFDEQTVQEVEEFVHGAEFSPDDVSMFEIKPKEDVHGLGYKPLKESGVLSQKYGTVTSALKTSKRSKGIRGQAFGVGAFEEDDEEIYTNYDLSQYDFEVGASTSLGQHDVPKCEHPTNVRRMNK